MTWGIIHGDNKDHMQNILEFWTHHNISIISWLIISILLLTGLVVYYMAFVAEPQEASGGAQISADIENTLKKLLENQPAGPAAGAAPASVASADKVPQAEPSGEGDSAQIDAVKAQVEEKQKRIAELEAQIATNAAAATAAVAAAAAEAPAAAAGNGAQLQERMKELEARLSEYEIIAEDIADLSFYKEENRKLQKELDELRGSSSAPAAPVPTTAEAEQAPVSLADAPASAAPVQEPAPAAAEPVPAPEPTPAPAAAEAPALSLVPEPTVSEPVAVQPATAEPAAPVAEAATAPTTPPADESPIDDDLMKEFAAAVESQKTGNEPQKPTTDENAQLLNQFEEFVKKN